MPFEFIDNSHIDRKSRQVIRSHVAKGRNLGKVIARRKQTGSKSNKTVVNQAMLEHAQAVFKQAMGPAMEQQFGDVFSGIPFPSDMNADARRLVRNFFACIAHSICPPELAHAINFNEADSIWIRLVFMDDAYLHCTVAMSIAVTDFLLDRQLETTEANRHLQHTFRVLNERLSGDEAVSDSTMGAIVALSQYERIRGHHRQGLVHLDGLRRIVELRGGLAKMRQEINQKLFRADLEHALHLGSPTRFSLPDVPGQTTALWLRDRFNQFPQTQFRDFQIYSRLSHDLQDVFLDVISVSWVLNGSSGLGIKLDGYVFHDVLIYIGYRLIHISPLVGRQHLSHLENTLHLGLTAFMASFLMPLGHNRLECHLLTDLTRSTIQKHFEEDKESQQLLLWTLFLGIATIFSEGDDQWMIPSVIRASTILEVRTWVDVCRVLAPFPWLHTLHRKAGAALWNRVTEARKQPVRLAQRPVTSKPTEKAP